MSIKTIIATLVVASSSIASARPLTSGPIVRDHRTASIQYDASFDANVGFAFERPVQQQSWVSLGTFDGELYADPVEFRIRPRMGAVEKIMLDGTAGKTRVTEVQLHFANGRTSVIKTDRYIGERGTITTIPASRSYVIDVPDFSRVTSVSVIGYMPKGSAFSVYAM